jgi:hypothetical protein
LSFLICFASEIAIFAASLSRSGGRSWNSTVHEALKDDWPILNSSERPGCNGEIVLNQFDICDFRLLRKIQLGGIGDLHFAPVNQEHLGGRFAG